jgi:hypothetical protein
MLAAQAGAFIIFKDLADISQWLVQSSRDFTMMVWYNRYRITIISSILLILSLIIWFQDQDLASGFVVSILILIFIFNIYSGLFNPAWMFRPQQHAAMFVPVKDAADYLQRSIDYAHFGNSSYDRVDDISMLVLETDNGVYAYSDYYLVQPHVVKADTVDGEPVIMTYCGLTNLGIAYSPVIDGQQLELSVMTQLKNNLVLKDANTGEPIQQIWGHMEGQSERGSMKEFATIRMPFSSFRNLYPDGKVFINEIAAFKQNPLLALWDTVVRNIMLYWGVGLQWKSQDKPAFPTVKEFDQRLPMKELVYALNVDEDYVAYTRDFIINNAPINVAVGHSQIVVAYDNEYDVVTAFFNDTDKVIDNVDVFGRTPSGKTLRRVNTLKSKLFWFILAEFYPQVDVNRM